MVLKNKGQTWSFDLIIAVVLFIVVVAVFYVFLTRDDSTRGADDQQDYARIISTQLVCDSSSSNANCFIENGAVNEAKLKALSDNSYDVIKNSMQVEGEFCMYMVVESDDGTTSIIPFTNTLGDNFVGIGSDEFSLTEDYACGDEMS